MDYGLRKTSDSGQPIPIRVGMALANGFSGAHLLFKQNICSCNSPGFSLSPRTWRYLNPGIKTKTEEEEEVEKVKEKEEKEKTWICSLPFIQSL